MSDTLIINTTSDILLQEGTEGTILSQGIVGPPGPAGPPGPPGPPGVGTSSPWQETVFVLAGNQTVFTLPATPAPSTVSMFTNGLRETNSNFSVVGNVVTVTGFLPTSGDTVGFVYQ